MSNRGNFAQGEGHGGGLLAPVRVQVAGAPPWEQVSECSECVTVKESLEHALGAFKVHSTASSARLWADGAGGVSLYRRDDNTVVVVGRNVLADAVRQSLPVKGWCNHPLPRRVTMLSTLREELGSRTFSLLRREGFTNIEEVAAVPDGGLLDIRNIGMTTMATLRMVAANRRINTGGGSVTLSEYHTAELLMLLKILITHVKPHRKDELTQAVAKFIDEAFPAVRPEATNASDPRDLQLP